MCYGKAVDDKISVRELRNNVSAVLRRVETGARLIVTVDRRPVAQLVPLSHRRVTVPWDEFQARFADSRADPELLDDLRAAIPQTTDDVWPQ